MRERPCELAEANQLFRLPPTSLFTPPSLLTITTSQLSHLNAHPAQTQINHIYNVNSQPRLPHTGHALPQLAV